MEANNETSLGLQSGFAKPEFMPADDVHSIQVVYDGKNQPWALFQRHTNWVTRPLSARLNQVGNVLEVAVRLAWMDEEVVPFPENEVEVVWGSKIPGFDDTPYNEHPWDAYAFALTVTPDQIKVV